MPFSEFETKGLQQVVEAFVETRRPPLRLRSQVDMAFRIAQQSVEICEVRPRWRGEPGEMVEHSVAKATFVRARGCWRVYWKRADFRWHSYQAEPEVDTIERFLALVGADEYACFFG